jgi:hypothetical protein
MSYAHTKRRKNIAKLKRRFPKTWREEFFKADAHENYSKLVASASDTSRVARQTETESFLRSAALPARLTSEQAAWILGVTDCSEEDCSRFA